MPWAPRYAADGDDAPSPQELQRLKAEAKKARQAERAEATIQRQKETAQQAETVTRELEQRKAEGAPLLPVGVDAEAKGPQLGKTFWSQAWQRHLESCTAYEHRLPKGRTLLRQGRVYDVSIQAGRVTALVTDPTRVAEVLLRLSPLETADVDALRDRVSQQAGSWLDLLAGRWGDELLRELTRPEVGLFPSMSTLRASCTCEDWADICPHAAAVLYALALKFDTDPALFFTLRGLSAEALWPVSAGDIDLSLSLTDASASQSVLSASAIEDVFGFSLAEEDTEHPLP